MKNKIVRYSVIGFLTIFSPWTVLAGLTNADVIKMTNAGLSPDIILTTISSSPDNKFDTSVDGLIALKEAKVPEAVISCMVSGKAPDDTTKAAAKKSQEIGPEEIIMVEEGKETQLLYRLSGLRSQARGLGYGGVATYDVLPGATAELRIKNKKPSFIVAVPKNAQVQSYITLANFAVRKNGNREVMVSGGGVMGMSSYEFGIHKDRIVEVATEKLADQSRAKEGFVLFKATPKNPLAAGEYAFVVTPSMAGTLLAPGMAMSQAGGPCYDFGVD